MGSLFSPILLLLAIFRSSLSLSPSSSRAITSPQALDLLIRDHTTNLSSPTNLNIRTGIPKTIHLPSNLSDITATTIRLRCGSLHRYGASLNEFRLPSGVSALPCVERLLLIRQNLGSNNNWSTLYHQAFNFRRYNLVSPILGILAYNAGDDLTNHTDPFEIAVYASPRSPIKIDFKGVPISSKSKHYCATFESGAIKLLNMVAPLVCVAEKLGHFALVEAAPLRAPPRDRWTPAVGTESETEGRESKWKVAVGSSVGAVIGAFLLGLLVIAMGVRAKKRTKVEEERVRRAYEEEALQVSMVGHVRAPVASGTRTAPFIEHQYRPPR